MIEPVKEYRAPRTWNANPQIQIGVNTNAHIELYMSLHRMYPGSTGCVENRGKDVSNEVFWSRNQGRCLVYCINIQIATVLCNCSLLGMQKSC